MKKKFTLTEEQLQFYKKKKSPIVRVALEGLLGAISLGCGVGLSIANPGADMWIGGLVSGGLLISNSISKYIKTLKIRKAIENNEVDVIGGKSK